MVHGETEAWGQVAKTKGSSRLCCVQPGTQLFKAMRLQSYLKVKSLRCCSQGPLAAGSSALDTQQCTYTALNRKIIALQHRYSTSASQRPDSAPLNLRGCVFSVSVLKIISHYYSSSVLPVVCYLQLSQKPVAPETELMILCCPMLEHSIGLSPLAAPPHCRSFKTRR